MLARLASVLVIGLLLVPRPAVGQSPADVAAARELFKQGAQLIKEGRWEEAEDRLTRSLALKPAPIAHYSLAVAQQHTGNLVEALENFRAFLAAPVVKATEAYREPARQSVAELQQRVARVNITVKPAGLQGLRVTIDKDEVPTIALDQERLVNPGVHVLKASAPGYRDASQPFDLPEGGSTELTLELAPAPEQPAQRAEGSADTPGAPRGEPDAPESSFPVAGVVLLGGGIAVAAAGLIVGIVGWSEASDAPTRDGPEADAARTKGIAGDVVLGVGAAAAAVGLILVIVGASGDDEAPAAARARPWAQGSVTGVELSW